jgi:hypothetical protein
MISDHVKTLFGESIGVSRPRFLTRDYDFDFTAPN